MEFKAVIMEKREFKIVNSVEWLCEILSENIKISVFLDGLIGLLEELKPNKKGKYDLRKLDEYMKKMPEIKHEEGIKAFIEEGIKELHKYGLKAFDGFYEPAREILNGLVQAECLFTNETMKFCGEADEEMFHKDDEDDEDD